MVILRKGRVKFKEMVAGFIEETDDGYRFFYDQKYLESDLAHPVSVTMPLQAQPFESRTLHPFFDGLIPEGWILSVVVKNCHRRDPVEMLGQIFIRKLPKRADV